jgi:radical SAM enzyme (TIGR01210 family)
MTDSSLGLFPAAPAERDAWIVARRPERNVVDPLLPYAFHVEDERTASGEVVPVATIFLTNRECPWRCVMCDLWRNTSTESVPIGAIPAQIDYALERLGTARQIKLYNSGSFFDTRAIPFADHAAITARVAQFERVIVECHPSLVGESCIEFKQMLRPQLEVAIGLETAHPQILERLNKRMTLTQFARAAQFLRESDIDLRVFILVKPPWMAEEESVEWAMRSLELAYDRGATAATLIPTRGGNGAMEDLAAAGLFQPPKLAALEASMAGGLAMKRGRVFTDLWDVHKFASCKHCAQHRIGRLHAMNLQQSILPIVDCSHCGGMS